MGDRVNGDNAQALSLTSCCIDDGGDRTGMGIKISFEETRGIAEVADH
jgi:hypothetical protein